MNDDIKSLIRDLNESHERFVQAIITRDSELATLAYANYVRQLAIVLEESAKRK